MNTAASYTLQANTAESPKLKVQSEYRIQLHAVMQGQKNLRLVARNW